MKTIQESIYSALKKYSRKNAIEDGNVCMKYSDIEKNVNRLLKIIIHKSEKKFPCYILLFSNRLNYLISIISILFRRGIFVPVDISLPHGRILQIINQCDADYIISDCNFAKRISVELDIELILFSWNLYCQDSEIEFVSKYGVDDPIYIYFTSGTTSQPKGVLGRNCGLQHFIEWEIKEFNIQENTRFAQLTSPSFDPFLRDIFVPLISGSIICFLDDYYSVNNLKFLYQWLTDKRINMFHCVPSLFHSLVYEMDFFSDKNNSLICVFLAGEAVNISDIKKVCLVNDSIKFVNLYGPTETTLAKMFHVISKEDIINGEIPLGIPIPDTKVYLLNDNNCIQESGEICIESRYCSLGYIDTKLNIDKYIDSPFSDNIKLYKTGDLGKINNKGEVLFYGRKDRQIKISGISANLFAIEQSILSNSNVDECCVVLCNKNNRLVCYYTCREHLDENSLNKYLLNYYQKIFIPKKYIKIEKFKMNSNGKLDSNYYSKILNS